jgi:precorrin-6B methylase 1
MKHDVGSLTAVGVGIAAPAQATVQSIQQIKAAEKVLSIVADPVAAYWLLGLNVTTESLQRFYGKGKNRQTTYDEMVEYILGFVRRGLRVCVASYGHPGITAYPLHEALRRAREEGFRAEMLPGVSAADCLFAEIGIDPAESGCLSFEATDFLVHHRMPDPMCDLILWQVGAIGISDARSEHDAWNREGIAILTERLLETYRPGHEVIVYEASLLPICPSTIDRVAIERLPSTRVSAMSTLYVPAMEKPELDVAMLDRLRISQTSKPPAATTPG